MTNAIDKVSNADVAKACASGDEKQIRSALALVVADKKEIEMQLAASKIQMLATRSTLVEGGSDHRHAQIEATASVDVAWRGRAVQAAMIKDRQILRLNGALSVLLKAPRSKGQKVTAMPERKAVAFRFADGDIYDAADQIESWLTDGWSSISVIPHPDGAIVIFRRDFDVQPRTTETP